MHRGLLPAGRQQQQHHRGWWGQPPAATAPAVSYPQLHTSYTGRYLNGDGVSGGVLRLGPLSEDTSTGAFTGSMQFAYQCTQTGSCSCAGAVQNGHVSMSSDVSFTFVPSAPYTAYCPAAQDSFTGHIQPDGGLSGSFTNAALGGSGTFTLS